MIHINKKFILSTLFSALVLLGSSCKDKTDPKPDSSNTNPLDTVTNFSGLLIPQNGTLNISIYHHFDNDSLVFNTRNYIMASGDTINVERFRYYISNITLVEPNGNEYNTRSYHLINPLAGRNLNFSVSNVKPGIYSGIKFLIGIDSLTNTTGVGTGEIDPALGMFWDWNTGYIFYQIEGRTIDGRVYAFHLGGNQNLIKLTYNINIYKVKSVNPKIHLKLNFAEVFKTPVIYDFNQHPMQMHTPASPAAPIIRDNLMDCIIINNINP